MNSNRFDFTKQPNFFSADRKKIRHSHLYLWLLVLEGDERGTTSNGAAGNSFKFHKVCVCMFVGGSVLGFSLIIIKCSVGDPEFG